MRRTTKRAGGRRVQTNQRRIVSRPGERGEDPYEGRTDRGAPDYAREEHRRES